MQIPTTGFVAMLALSLLMAPLATEAQQPVRTYRLGILALGPRALDPPLFFEELRRLGYIEGRNVLVEYRYADTQNQLSVLADELVQLKVDLILTRGTRATHVAKQATTTIPIVFHLAEDPVQSELIASFARPGGNLTGQVVGRYEEKALEMLKEVIPGVTRVACPCQNAGPAILAAAQELGLQFQCIAVQGPEDFDRFFTTARSAGADAVLVHNVAWFFGHQKRLGELTVENQLPAIGYRREFAEAGGLMSYGPRREDIGRRLAWQVDRILQGTKPADLPVEQPMQFELVLNLKTAQALGLTIPPTVLFQANEMIR